MVGREEECPHQCQSFALVTSHGLLIVPIARKLLLNFKRFYTVSSLTEDKRTRLTANTLLRILTAIYKERTYKQWAYTMSL